MSSATELPTTKPGEVPMFAVLCPSTSEGTREFQRYASRAEAQTVADLLCEVGDKARVVEVIGAKA